MWFSKAAQIRKFCLLTYPPRWKRASSKKTSSCSISLAHLVKRKWGGCSWGFSSCINWILLGVILRSLGCKLVREMFNSWERWWVDVEGFSRTLSATIRTVQACLRLDASTIKSVSRMLVRLYDQIWYDIFVQLPKNCFFFFGNKFPINPTVAQA